LPSVTLAGVGGALVGVSSSATDASAPADAAVVPEEPLLELEPHAVSARVRTMAPSHAGRGVLGVVVNPMDSPVAAVAASWHR
jgi:hypothetical protein